MLQTQLKCPGHMTLKLELALNTGQGRRCSGHGWCATPRCKAEHPLESRAPPVGRCQEVAETISLLWSVSDRTWLADLEHPGFTLVDGSQLWIHQPLLDPGSSDAKQRLQEPRGRRPPFCRSQPAGLRSCGSEALFKTPKDIHGK